MPWASSGSVSQLFNKLVEIICVGTVLDGLTR